MVSLSGGAVIYLLTRSIVKSLIFVIPGILIDVDHIFDYICSYGWKLVNFKEFTRIFYNLELKKVYVILHGYELLAFLGFLVWIFKVEWGWILFVTLSIHLAMDQIYCVYFLKGRSLWFYFLSYRISRRFENIGLNVVKNR